MSQYIQMMSKEVEVVTYEKHNDSWKDRLKDVSVHNIVLVHHHLAQKITSKYGTVSVIVIVFVTGI